MSVIMQTHLVCDGKDCEKSFGTDGLNLPGREHRENMVLHGWRHDGGKDYCSECWDIRFQEKKNAKKNRFG